MTKEEVMTFVNANPKAFVATVEGDKPHVRALGTYKADARGILMQISTVKGIYKELLANPKVELCFNSADAQIRVSGTAEFLEDKALKEQVVIDRPFLKGLVDQKGLDAIRVFRVANATASVWTMATNFEPREFIKL
jgi:pyridoxamine 5'-phosphate oxidase